MGKLFEAVFEAAPFLVLQAYVAVIEEDYTLLSIISLISTCLSLGYTVAFWNSKLVLKDELKTTGMFVILFLLSVIDVILRTLSIAILLKVVISTSLRISIAACYIIAY